MKHDFYYKEEFPLELRITIENMHELAYILAAFSGSDVAAVRDSKSKVFQEYPAFQKDAINYLAEEKVRNGGTSIDHVVYKDIAKVSREQIEKQREKEGSDPNLIKF